MRVVLVTWRVYGWRGLGTRGAAVGAAGFWGIEVSLPCRVGVRAGRKEG